jgi:hypothetical protein
MWASIDRSQTGARPHTAMWIPTVETIEKMQQYKYAWFIDFTEAFNMIH